MRLTLTLPGGGIMGGDTPAPPPPPPDPPEPVERDDPEVAERARETRQAAKRRRGRAASILTEDGGTGGQISRPTGASADKLGG